MKSSKKEPVHLHVELNDVLARVGVFGPWQFRIVIMLMVASFIGGLPVMNTAVTAAVPEKFYCMSSDCFPHNRTTGQDHAYFKKVEKKTHKDSLPIVSLPEDEGSDGIDRVGDFTKPDYPTPKMCKTVQCDFLPFRNETKSVKCNASNIYWMEGLPLSNTIITQTNNLCEMIDYKIFLYHPEALYKTFLDVLYMAGIFLGGKFFAFVGESYGRRFSLGSAIFTTLMGTNFGLIRNPWVYAVSRFIVGLGAINCYLMAWHLVMELLLKDAKISDCIGVTYFSLMGNFLSIAYALGEASTALIAKLLHQYEDFLICISVICGASMLIILFLPESPHWFILNGKREDLLATMQEAAGYNGVELTDLQELVPLPRPMDREITLARKQFSLWSSQLLRPTLSLIFSWISMAIIYYGINFSIQHLDLVPDDVLAIALVALVEIPAYLVNAFLMDIVGRKPIILIFTLVVPAIGCIFTLAAKKNETLFTVCLLIMKSAVAGAFTLIRIYTIEFYPGFLKEKAFGLCKGFASFAAIFSPLMTIIPVEMKKDGMTCFLSLSLVLTVITGVLFIFLPDTIGFATPLDMDDVQFMKENSKPTNELYWKGWNPPVNPKPKRGEK